MIENRPLVYLAGAIEHAPDRGRAWRARICEFLENELDHRAFDPTVNEWELLTPEERRFLRSWKLDDPERFKQTVRKIIAHDLDIVENKADYLVCLWDRYAALGGGTHAELTIAHRLGKPVYMVLELPRQEVSGWVLSCADEIFPDLETLQRELKRLYGTACS